MVSSERRHALRDLLEAALNCEPAIRETFVREASHGDEELSKEALWLLEQIHAKHSEPGTQHLTESQALDHVLRDSSEIETAAYTETVSSEEFRGTERFDVRRKLGSGGFGTVYESYDRDQNRLIALKVLRRTDPRFLYQFKREFRALVDIRHPNLVELYELFSERQFWFFTMELVRGVDYLRYMQNPRRNPGCAPCDMDRLRAASLQLAEGILALHAVGILHRDIKPGNVLISRDGRVRLLDFGLVRETDLNDLQSVMLVGTPAYMAPERLAQLPSDESADWFSFGVMIFQALTGSVPERHHLPQRDDSATLSTMAFPSDVPDDLKRLCLDLLTIDRAKRPAGVDVVQRLGGIPSRAARAAVTIADEVLIGREPQLTELATLLNLTKQGRTVLVNMYGKSGIGKSAILRTFRHRLERTDPDVVVLIGRCHENETVPFKGLDALIDGLSHYLRTLPPIDAEALTPRDPQSLIRMFPVLAQVESFAHVRRKAVEIADAQELRQRAFASLQDLLARLAERHTVVLAIDDVQWGDLDSAAFLRALFAMPSPPSLLLIASYRIEDATTSPFLQAWQASLADAKAVTVHDLELGGLTPSESAEMAGRLLRQHVDGNVGHAPESIAEESGGNPFLIEQFARHMRPETVVSAIVSFRDAIQQRLAELPESGQRLLETLAVAAQPLSEALAFEAAAFPAADRPILLTLVADRLLRFRETSGARQIELYHDRLREMIVASMPSELHKQKHFQLAHALETDAGSDPAVVSIHWREAGRLDLASKYAVVAADQAADALAFERAARFYRLAVDEGSWSRDESIALQRKLAVALANAGRGAQSAAVYLKAAVDAGVSERSQLQRSAAEQLLRAGHVDEGLAVLDGIARGLGIWLSTSRWQIVLSLLWHRFRSNLSALPFPASSRTPAARDLMVLDVYWALFVGLGILDPIRAMDFQARHRVLAKRVGEPRRLAISLAAEAVVRSATERGGRTSVKVDGMISTARELSTSVSSAEVLGFIAAAEAMCACMTANWRRGLDLAERADRFLSEQCSGVAWERATMSLFHFTAAFHLGAWTKISDYSRHLPQAMEEAKARGDVYAAFAAMPAVAFPLLISDQPAVVEQFLRETIADLPANRFLMPNVWVFTTRAMAFLYKGEGERARAEVIAQWPLLSKSLFFRVRYTAIMAFELRGRTAVSAAAGAATTRDRQERVDEALQFADKLSRQHFAWSNAAAHLIRAGIASVKQQKTAAIELLAVAEKDFRTADMAQYVSACQYRRGALLGGDKGRELVATAETWAGSQGVMNPSRVFDMLAPGRWDGY